MKYEQGENRFDVTTIKFQCNFSVNIIVSWPAHFLEKLGIRTDQSLSTT